MTKQGNGCARCGELAAKLEDLGQQQRELAAAVLMLATYLRARESGSDLERWTDADAVALEARRLSERGPS